MEVWGELSKQRGVGASKILILGRVGIFRIRYMCVGVLGTDLGSLLHVAIFLLFLQIPPTYKSYSVINSYRFYSYDNSKPRVELQILEPSL